MSEGKCCCSGGGTGGGDAIKDYVKEKYGQIARNAQERKEGSCCGEGTSKDAITRDLYSEAEKEGLPVEALLASMGCANPIALAELKPGEVVLDLGSGGGIDVLLSAKRVGPTGKAYGLDMTDEMLALARQNQLESGLANVEFLKGEIESIPLPDSSVDVVISNCVINLSSDKDQVLKEAFRVLKPGGRFAVADIVLTKELPERAQQYVALWTGCIAGALRLDDYKSKLSAAGFAGPSIDVARTYSLDDADALMPASIIAELGHETVSDMAGSFISGFVRATKPKRCCCCCG